MGRDVVGLHEVDRSMVELVGGKGAQLGEVARVDGVRVPPGFCVTTEAFRRVTADATIAERLDRLARLRPDERASIRSVSAEVRGTLEAVTLPKDLAASITGELAGLGGQAGYAVRSSATAEDLPSASFAGQHDTYLNVVGTAAVVEHVRRCWASLFTERAVVYRVRNGVDHRKVAMAVVVQQMVLPRAAGVLFTADPLTGSRGAATIEATFGLGEAMVAGLVNADVYTVRDGAIAAMTIGTKERAVVASGSGGTEQRAVEPERRRQRVLTDAQALRLAGLGRRIEAHFGRPQDIEWCLVDDELTIVQARPITTLFPVPDVGDHEKRIYISVGHNQMMTDAMKPLGLSFWQMTTPRPMAEAGGRLFVDVTETLASPTGRAGLLEMAGRSDPLMADALQTIVEREGLAASAPPDGPDPDRPPAEPTSADEPLLDADPAIVDQLIRETQASIAAVRRDIATKSGTALLDFIQADIAELRRVLFDRRGRRVFMTAIEASWWLNEHLEAWLGERNAVDTLTQSVDHNVTSDMGLALLGVADAIRPHPAVVAFLEGVEDDDFLDELPALPGGREARDAVAAFLESYGMRCVGEIDITRPRWSERPRTLVPLILGNVRNFAPGAGERRFEQGRREALAKEREVISRLRSLPDGDRKAAEAKAMIDRVRTFIGYREYPKFGMVSRYLVYKRALLQEAERLVQARVLLEKEDAFFLRFEELRDVVRSGHVDDELIRERRDAFLAYQGLTPPRVLTSEGEAVAGRYRRDDVPPGALVGLPVSAGTVEGRARVILEMAEADVGAGDILVTAYTDPSWTPLFVAVAGLVTEVGGLMTHGAVIAREYGLPAVVGVERATRQIHDGQRIRVDGTRGCVEILG